MLEESNVKPRILIADDHEIVRDSIGTLLSTKWNYEICGEASDGLEAIDKVRELRPDLVILDLRMPLMNGTMAAKQIRSIAPATKIVFLSIYDSEMMRELGKLAGADAGVSKKSRMDELHEVIAGLVGD